MAEGRRYRVPASWSPEPPAPDDLAARARRHADTHPESRDLIEELLAAVHALRVFVEAEADMWEAEGMLVTADALRGRLADLTPTPSPVPPWPGAVLSGCVDEDGVPTWLAQAGQVRGEQVRNRTMGEWHGNGFVGDSWVEVRAPRAVPVPETERVQLGAAVVGGLLAICREGGTLDLGRGDVRIHTENGALVASTSESMFTVEIAPDGTVEVLKDGDR